MEVAIAKFATVYVVESHICEQCQAPAVHVNYALMMRACCKHSISGCDHKYIGIMKCGQPVGISDIDAPKSLHGVEMYDYNCEQYDTFVAFIPVTK